MAFLWKKQAKVETAIEDYLKETDLCVAAFQEALKVYFDEGLTPRFEELVEKTHSHESRSDDERRQIEQTLYERALIPESRGDILGMLESLDAVPNKCESVLYQILFQKMSIPQDYRDDIQKLAKINAESFLILTQAMKDLLSDPSKARSAGSEVDKKESESDRIERKLIKSIFSTGGDKAEKILLKEVILEIGSISDRAENAADRLTIIAIKHQA